MTKAVVEAGADRGHASVSAVPPSSLSVPATLHASLLGRLDRLGPSAKNVAQVGAAIGRDFSHELLTAAAPLAEPELQEALRRLVEAGLVFQRGMPPMAEYLFKHALVQDTAYETLLKSRRQMLHRQIADSGSASCAAAVSSSWEKSRPMAAPTCATVLAAGPSRSRRPSSEACKVAGTASGRRWHGGYRRIAAIGAGLDHRLGQFLDKERHPVGSLDDLVDNIGRQCPEIAGELMHERRPFAAAEPVQRDHRHLRPSDPGRLELGPVGCDE